MEEQTEKAYIPYPAIVVVALVVLLGVYLNLRQDYYMEKGTKETCATVYELTTSDAYGNRDLHYYYYADSIKYTGVETSDYFLCEDSNDCVGYTFKIVYAVQNPNVGKSFLEHRCD